MDDVVSVVLLIALGLPLVELLVVPTPVLVVVVLVEDTVADESHAASSARMHADPIRIGVRHRVPVTMTAAFPARLTRRDAGMDPY